MIWLRGEFVPAGSKVEGRSLPAGHVYAGGDSTKARLRRLKQNWKRIEKAAKKSPLAADGRERILDHAADDPHPEYTALHLGLACMLAAEESGSSLSSCMASLCDELDARQESSDATQPTGDHQATR
jgi:hypothetical protein